MAETLDGLRAENAGSPPPVMLDPFDFLAGASRIRGLGTVADGEAAGHHAFHTPYVDVAPGSAGFSARFEGLAATSGTLVLQINMLLPGAGAQARIVAKRRLSLSELADGGGAASIACDGFEGCAYAFLGVVVGDTDAHARGLTITLDTPITHTTLARQLETVRRTVLRTSPDDPLGALFMDGPASLAEPVSQMCTAAQFEEPAYALWLERLHEPRVYHRKQWEFIYILQVLDRYGMLRPGMRGLGFGVGREPMPAVMAALGADVVATDLPPDHDDHRLWDPSGQHGTAVDSLRRPAACDDETLTARVSFRPVDMTAIPADLRGFDFTWSSCAYEHLGSIAAGLQFVIDSVACLRPGGIAVHTSEFNLSSNDHTLEDMSTVLFRRRDMETLALSLIARGHQVAPIRLDVGDRPLDRHVDLPPYLNDPHLKMAFGRYTTTSFGIIVRHGDV